MLERSAQLVGDLCKKYKIPVSWLYAADLKAGSAAHHDARTALAWSATASTARQFALGSSTGFPRESICGTRVVEHGASRMGRRRVVRAGRGARWTAVAARTLPRGR